MYHVKRKLLAIVLSLIMVFSLVPSNLAFAAEGAYIHNPMDNPKTAADIIEDPAAVYGYRPNPDSVRLGESLQTRLTGRMRNRLPKQGSNVLRTTPKMKSCTK